MTRDDKKNISEIVKYSKYFDGLIWVDNGSTDGTKELLEENKGEGKVIDAVWCNRHSFSMNFYLNYGGMKNGDWFFTCDGQERFNEKFLGGIRNLLESLESQGVQTLFLYGKLLGAKFYDDQFFHGSPHYGLQNIRQGALDLKEYWPDEKDSRYRLMDGEEGGRPVDNFVNHEIKYYLYGESNHLLLGRENKIEEYQDLERDRVSFRLLCQERYGLSFTSDSLLSLLKTDKWKDDEVFVKIFKKQHILKTFYRYRVLETPIEEIIKDRETWEYID